MRLKTLRKSRGYTQEELAHLSGVEQPTISRLESGNSSVTLKTLKDIAKALDYPVHFILMDDLGEDELNLLDTFRRISADSQETWKEMAQAAKARLRKANQ